MIEPAADDPPEVILDYLRFAADLDPSARRAWVDRIVERNEPDRIREALRASLGDLGRGDLDALLRLIEAFGDPGVSAALAGAVEAAPDLAADRAWDVLSVLDASGDLADYPSLVERRDDLDEILGDEASIEELAASLDEPDGLGLALHGLAAVEPAIRAEIVAGLADRPGGPGLVDFLRLLTFAHDPSTRWAALDALDDRDPADPAVRDAWRSIAADHPDDGVVLRALGRLDGLDGETFARSTPAPEVVRTLVTAVDGEGRATIAIGSRSARGWAGAAFLCHVRHGVIEVVGREGTDADGLDRALAGLNETVDVDLIEGHPRLAGRLLAECLALTGPSASPAIRYWVERTAGPLSRSELVAGFAIDSDPGAADESETSRWADDVLRACPGWADRSDLAAGLAREIALRDPEPGDDPSDGGAYRYLFEHRLEGRIELYRSMLLWMAGFWQAAGAADLATSAVGLAVQLSDPQHAVPSHPFFVALTRMSFERAAEAER